MMKAISVITGIEIAPKESAKLEEPSDEGPKIEEIETTESQAEEQLANVEQKLEAENEKQLGNAAYKIKDFETAHQHYIKAIKLDPTNPLLLSNRAAVCTTDLKYAQAIDFCQQALDVAFREESPNEIIS